MAEESKNEVPAELQIPAEPVPEIREDEVPAEVVEEAQDIAQDPSPTQAYIPKSAGAEAIRQTRWQKLKEFGVECRRVLRVTKKPSREEFKTIVKISGIGMAVIGFLGFFVTLIKELFF
jgi:protein transport protein SEC61 subunit gamma-like protein